MADRDAAVGTPAAKRVARAGTAAGDIPTQRSGPEVVGAPVPSLGPFVGRDDELTTLLDLMALARGGRGGFARVVGGAGSGKTRLLAELADRARAAGTTVLSVSCATSDVPLGPWRALGRAADEIMSTPHTPSGAVDVTVAAAAAITTFRRVGSSALLTIDDLHLADPASFALLRTLVPMFAGTPTLLVVTTRPPVTDPTPADAQIRLGGLTTPALEDRLRAAAPAVGAVPVGSVDVAAAAARLSVLTGGNPGAVRRLLAAGPGPVLAPVMTEPGPAAGRVLTEDSVGELLATLTPTQRDVLAVDSLLADVTSMVTVAQVLALTPAEVADATAVARRRGLLHPSGTAPRTSGVLPAVAQRLLDDLGEAGVQAMHARICTELRRTVGSSAQEVARHALRAGTRLPAAEVVELATAAAVEATRLFGFDEADAFFEAALSRAGDDAVSLSLLLEWSRTLQARGDVRRCWPVSLRAARLAMRLGDAEAAAEAAVRHASPPSWRLGDAAVEDLLRQVQAMGPSAPLLAPLLGALAVLTEGDAGDPVDGDAGAPAGSRGEAGPDPAGAGGPGAGGERGLAAAQRLAEQGVTVATRSGDPGARLCALLAWRAVHRGPDHLPRRREVSDTALALAQKQRRLDLVVDAGVRVATDAAEALDRASLDDAVDLVSWAAETSRQPRLSWRAACLESARLGLVHDAEGLRRVLARARAAGRLVGAPTAGHADLQMAFQLAMITGDAVTLDRIVAHPSVDRHPLGPAAMALVAARRGDVDLASRLIPAALTGLDLERNGLFAAEVLGQAAGMAGDVRAATALIELLAPYRDLGATDVDGLIFLGPIASTLAVLHRLVGDPAAAAIDEADAAAAHVRMGTEPLAWRRVGDGAAPGGLTPREHLVLLGMAEGRRNVDMAADLHFSLATIRRETSSVYRKLGVSCRAEAVAEAARLGLLPGRG